MRQTRGALIAILAAGSVLVAACSTTPAASTKAYKACLVTDTGGLGDKGFNDNSLKGLKDAKKDAVASDIINLESKTDADFAKNIDELVSQGCQSITTVGFSMGDVTKTKAAANPTIAFSIVDDAYDPPVANITGIVFATEQAGMLAGYVAAGVSKTGKIGTFGGANIPPVTAFMDGLSAGIKYYNKQKNKSVVLLGYDPAKPTEGSFIGGSNPWGDQAKGKALAQGFFQEGADIVVPIAGGTGIGSFAAAKDAGLYAIGVDVDQWISVPGYEKVILTSIQKVIDSAVEGAIKSASKGTLGGTNYVGTLANGGVTISPFHDLANLVSADLQKEVDALKAAIIAGTVTVKAYQ